MGIFTTGGYSGLATDIYSPVNESIDVSGYTNFHTLSLEAVAESERTYNNIMKSVGIAELRYFEKHGTEVVYEAGDVGSFFEKIKMFFKKLIDKVKAIFHAFMAKLNSFIKSDKDFAKKYEKEFTEKWSNVNDDYELINGYKFKNLIKLGDNEESSFNLAVDDWKAIVGDEDWMLSAKDAKLDDITNAKTANGNGQNSNTYDHKYKTATTHIKEHREDIQDKIRGAIFTKTGLKTDAAVGQAKVDASDFDTELFEAFRSNESDKQKLSKKDLATTSLDIINELKTANETRKAAENVTKKITKAIEDDIKKIEEYQKDLRNTLPKSNPDNTIAAEKLSYYSEITSLYRNHKEYMIQFKGAFLQALTQRSRQWKAVVAKVVAGGKKMNESYNYTNESTSYGSGSFLDSVTIK